MNNHFKDKVVWITGASSGIGEALAEQFAKHGAKIVLSARRENVLKSVQEKVGLNDKNSLIIPLDVTDYSSATSATQQVIEKFGKIDILVNNAGIAYRSVIEEMYPRGEMIQFQTNYFGAMHLIRLVLPKMREKGTGQIINVSSVSGMMAMPTMGVYSASKFALEGASEALWYELRPWNIRVSLIQPGFVHSNSFQNVKLTEKSKRSIANKNSEYHAYYVNMAPFIKKMMRWSPTTPEKIAKRIIKTMHKKSPRLRIPVTIDAWIFYYLRRLLPRQVYHHLLYRSLPKIRTWVKEKKF